MRAYSSMPSREFIDQLRAVAIAAKASPLFIDQVDQLRRNEDAEADHEKDIESLEDDHDRKIALLEDRIDQLEVENKELRELLEQAEEDPHVTGPQD